MTQFGMPYGIMNKSKNDRKKKLKQILNFSKKKILRHYILQNIMVIQINFLVLKIYIILKFLLSLNLRIY